MGVFTRHEQAFIDAGKEPLLDIRLLKIPPMRAGLITYLSQQFIIMGTFFVLPLFLQTVLGFDALETGIILLPLIVILVGFCAGWCTVVWTLLSQANCLTRFIVDAQRFGPAHRIH